MKDGKAQSQPCGVTAKHATKQNPKKDFSVLLNLSPYLYVYVVVRGLNKIHETALEDAK